MFPCPASLKKNVQFWKDIFTRYYTYQVVLHDRDDLDIRYVVIDFKKEFGGKKYSTRQKSAVTKKYKEKYSAILSRLEKYKGTGAELSGDTHRVFKMFKDIKTGNKFSHAKRNIRAQGGLKDRFRKSLALRGKYIEKIHEILREEGLPVELAALCHVESSFNTLARSKYGASGIWQFTRSTGRHYLRVSNTVDERKSPYLSTYAVAKLFKGNYEQLRNWPLTILAHNYGCGGVKRAVRKLHTRDIETIIKKFRSRRFGFASKNFYPEFLAALEVEKNYKKYFGDIPIEAEIDAEPLKLSRNTSVYTILKNFKISRQTFTELNPHISSGVFNKGRSVPRRTTVYLPARELFAYKDSFKSIKVPAKIITIPPANKVVAVDKAGTNNGADLSIYSSDNSKHFWVYVNPDETLWHYSMWSDLSISTIRKANKIRRSRSLRLNQKIRIPLTDEDYKEFEQRRKGHHKKVEDEFNKQYKVESLFEHVVQEGESVWEICNNVYRVPLWLITKYNNLKKLGRIQPGDVIYIPVLKKAA